MSGILAGPAALMLSTVFHARGDAGAPAQPAKVPTSISVSVAAPVDLLVTDPEGLRTGVDPSNGKPLQGIPQATYGANEGMVIGKSGASGVVKVVELRQPAPGEYELAVTGASPCSYALEVKTAVAGGKEALFHAPGIPISTGEVHTYFFTVPAVGGQPTVVVGTFDGGGSQPRDVKHLLTYVTPGETTTKLPSGQMYYGLHVVYGPQVRSETFKATLNGVDITNTFKPQASTAQMVNLQLRLGANVLLLSITGRLKDGNVGTDNDRLVFRVP